MDKFQKMIEDLQLKQRTLFEKGRDALGEGGTITVEDRAKADGYLAESVQIGDSVKKLIDAKAGQDLTDKFMDEPVREFIADPSETKYNGEMLEGELKLAKKALEKYFRAPNADAFRQSATAEEYKTMSRLTDPAGGYFVHPEFSTSIITKLRDRVWIRQLADLYTIGSAQLKLPVWDRTYTLPAVAEKGTIAVQSADTAGQKTFTPHKRSTILQITQELLEDSFFDVEAKLREMVIEQIAEIEEPLFIEGTGAGEPTGILNATGITALDILTSGSGDMVPEDIVKVPMQLTAAYRRNKATVRWGIPRAQLLKIMLMRSNDDGANTGEFMWNPNFATGKPAELQGYVVEETEFMTAASQDGDPLLFFGDLRKYAIVDHGGISVQKLIELYILNEMVGLKFTKRMDAGVTDVNGFVRLNRT